MSEFYRFIRPSEFDFTRSQVTASEHGGICLYVVSRDGQYEAGYSICNPTNLFNRETARRLAKKAPRHFIEVKSVSALGILDGFRKLTGNRELFEELERILNKTQQAYHLASTYKQAVEALKLAERYHDLQS